MIVELARGPLETVYGEWQHIVYWDGMQQAIGMVYGDVKGKKRVPCRVHSSCHTAHTFLSVECDCREQMEMAMALIVEQGAGAIVWLDHEGRANGMLAHIASQTLKRQGMSQSDAYESLGFPRDARTYTAAAEVLHDLGIKSVTVLTNNPLKVEALRAAGLPIVDDDARVEIEPNNEFLAKQYKDKREVDGHLLSHE